MIHSLTSTLARFKGLSFKPGLNLLVARKTLKSTDRQTRNGSGKTSFVELVHFLLGASNKTSNAFLRDTPALATERFAIALDLGGQSVEVDRAPTGKPADVSIRLVRGDSAGWGVQPKSTRDKASLYFTADDWKRLLGSLMFGLPGADDPGAGVFPSFRMVFPYFARRDREGGFVDPEKHSKDQQRGDEQIALTFLMGLDVSIPRELQALREREAHLKNFTKLAKSGAFGGHVRPASEIFTQLSVAEQRLQTQQKQLESFRVIERYAQLEVEANSLTQTMARLADENEADRALVTTLEASLRSERPPRFADVERAYEEVRIVLPDLVRRRFEDVENFHASIIRNRRSHLEGEIAEARDRLQQRAAEMSRADQRRSEILAILQAGGALEQYTRFQADLAKLAAEVEGLRQAYQQAQTLEGTTLDLSLERKRLHKRLKDDHFEQVGVRQRAIQVFERLSESLYEDDQAGKLVIDATENGPSYRVQIPAGLSSGKNHMQIFCFDMMLMELLSARGTGPGFLIHDSALFDGVDGRQVGRALELGRQRAEAVGFQYIVAINEDALSQAELEAHVSLQDAVLPVPLTDETETGGLFGMRFD